MAIAAECNCCDYLVSTSPLLEYQRAAASGTKVGFSPFRIDFGPYYTSFSSNLPDDDNACARTGTGESAAGKRYLKRHSYLGPCHAGFDPCNPDRGSITVDVTLDPATGAVSEYSCSGSYTFDDGTLVPGAPTCADVGMDPALNACGDSGSVSEEYRTSNLISRTEANIGPYSAWSGDGGGSTIALRQLSPDEASYTIQRLRVRFSHGATSTCYFKVWLRKKFTATGGAVSYSPLATYVWIPSADPCDTGGPFYSPTYEILEGDTNGITAVEVYKVSEIEGYEPPDP